MLKIADIIKKYKEETTKLKLEESSGSAVSSAGGPSVTQGVSVAASQERNEDLGAIVSKLYEEIIVFVKQVYGTQLHLDQTVSENIGLMTSKIVECLEIDNKAFVIVALSDYQEKNDFFYYHIANVFILALYMGVVIGYSQPRLTELGIAAFLHDIGMLEFRDIMNKEEVFSPEDVARIVTHPTIAADILNKYEQNISPRTRTAIAQEHERMDGHGYPSGLAGDAISDEARIIGIIDVYEALMHTRPHRQKLTSLESIKTILNSKSMFEQSLVKVLLERIGIFPVGTIVKLNTKEAGMVVKDNPRLPLRPVINVLFDALGKELGKSRKVDLADNSMVYIEECLKEYPKGNLV